MPARRPWQLAVFEFNAALSALTGLTSARAWSAWIAAAILTLGIHGLTLGYFPAIWQDEVQIIEYGRVFAAPQERDWSTNWRLDGRPVLLPNYLGGLWQEAAFHLSRGHPWGPRLSSLLGAVLASATLLGWLLARGSPPILALLGSCLLLWDPLFTESYRGARLEGWVFACIFSSCWCIHTAVTGAARGPRARVAAGFAGAFLALAGLIWVSAIILLPLVAHEFVTVGATTSPKALRSAALRMVVAAVAVVLAAWVPVWRTLSSSLSDLEAGVSYAAAWPSVVETVSVMLAYFKGSPLLLGLGLAAMVGRRHRRLGVSFFVAALTVGLTSPYLHRVVYLVPYLVLGITLLAESTPTEAVARTWRRLVAAGLCLAVTWAALLTLGLSGYTRGPLLRRHALSPERMKEVAREAIGAKAARVYLPGNAWEFYYAGRALGWRMFLLHDDVADSDLSRVHDLLATVDFAIVPEDGPSTDVEIQRLGQQGLVLVRRIVASRGPGSEGRLREPSPGNGRGYGTYLLFARAASGG